VAELPGAAFPRVAAGLLACGEGSGEGVSAAEMTTAGSEDKKTKKEKAGFFLAAGATASPRHPCASPQHLGARPARSIGATGCKATRLVGARQRGCSWEQRSHDARRSNATMMLVGATQPWCL